MSMFKPPVSPQRIAFEAWYRDNDSSANLVRTGKGYIDNTTRVAWRAWQAAQPSGKPAAWVYPEFFDGIARAGCWTAYAGDGVGQNPDGVVRLPLYREPQQASPVQEPENMTQMVDAAMVEMKNITPPLRRSECERLIRAALFSPPAAPVQEPVAKDNSNYRFDPPGLDPLYPTPPAAQPVVPDGYALIGIDMLKAWGKYDEVSGACCYPVGATQKGGA